MSPLKRCDVLQLLTLHSKARVPGATPTLLRTLRPSANSRLGVWTRIQFLVLLAFTFLHGQSTNVLVNLL